MDNYLQHLQVLNEQGFTILDNFYTQDEITQILIVLNNIDQSKNTVRKSADLFAIRQLLKEVPEVIPLILNTNLKAFIKQCLESNYFVVKSIYFDKPSSSNWYVSYHQDLTISVNKKIELANFGPWTVKQNQYAVQPPVDYLENIITLRIHLDETTESNGALKVIPTSHLKKIYRPETINWKVEKEVICPVKIGGIMLMKPLILHSSSRTTNNKQRRVIHIEFSNRELPSELRWSEFLPID
ncbi:MAG: phytanoyl-CoA dioxygenase family protein [Spirosomataceae bacterium]